MENPRSILATDCGSTTTKAILIELRGDEYRLIVRGEAPTTVEAPFENVIMGVINAITEVEELAGRKILNEQKRIISPQNGNVGVDVYVSTSSAGGGLQMMVAGVVRSMTAESAERAALGAGAIVMDVIASNDRRLPHQKIERIRQLRPDMILLSGGVDGGTVSHVVELAELICAADPKPRLGTGYELPIVFAGNIDARKMVKENLESKSALSIVENIRPTLERENLDPARDMIHELFMEHVMAQAPGYDILRSWTDAPIMPTPGAVGIIIETIARTENIEVVGVDIGGATTDVFSVFKSKFNRTVSANLGMSYSISNVLTSAGINNVMRWIPFDMNESDVRNRIKNKMIRPTTIPQTMEELVLEQAIAKEALRLAFEQHKMFATELKGVQQQRTISDTFDQKVSGGTLVNLMDLKLLVGSGGILSHAPRRHQAAMMLIDAFLPEGLTRLAVDSIFMMPQLGVLSTLFPKAATEVFEKDCLIHLGTSIVPSGIGKPGKEICAFELRFPGDREEKVSLQFGEMKMFELPLGQTVKFHAKPARHIDVGAGTGKPLEGEATGGVVGLVLDGRGRPLNLPSDSKERRVSLANWMKSLKVYPDDFLNSII
ncbi:MAG: methylaspartate mutase [Candidatus Schekmanbacteria bacterium RBG_13_48_7]|uniref:Methylaspartate mutase n=1 Tax=Candidatus Schekmanbacteria bacterium RBG_13_48_7 TaxID=1817878 RepID=A0A1F7S2U0_9BACT|nr:MAG: methylaspartate mutase [Candidatus Schekmanbacteria bacterium RBG_13_48_7]